MRGKPWMHSALGLLIVPLPFVLFFVVMKYAPTIDVGKWWGFLFGAWFGGWSGWRVYLGLAVAAGLVAGIGVAWKICSNRPKKFEKIYRLK